jgi:hypothetical protein
MRITPGSWKENRTMLVLIALYVPLFAMIYFAVALIWLVVATAIAPILGIAICSYLDRHFPVN